MNVYTFWEGPMPAYIKLCLTTWKFPFTVLNYANLAAYTDLRLESLATRFPLAQVADCVRVHVLRDNGGIWLDADTIMLTDRLPDATILGDPEVRTNTIGFLRAEKGNEFFKEWAAFQNEVIADRRIQYHWAMVGNRFTDEYLAAHRDVKIGRIDDYWPETYMVEGNATRFAKYVQFYFARQNHLSDLKPVDMLMLHNSWTPQWYKDMSIAKVMESSCTMSNILREVLQYG